MEKFYKTKKENMTTLSKAQNDIIDKEYNKILNAQKGLAPEYNLLYELYNAMNMNDVPSIRRTLDTLYKTLKINVYLFINY